MLIEILTIFPRLFDASFQEGIIQRAIKKGLIEIRITDLRHFTTDRHRTVDDRPFGGGEGMVLKPEPVFKAVEACRGKSPHRPHVVLLSPRGQRLGQSTATRLAGKNASCPGVWSLRRRRSAGGRPPSRRGTLDWRLCLEWGGIRGHGRHRRRLSPYPGCTGQPGFRFAGTLLRVDNWSIRSTLAPPTFVAGVSRLCYCVATMRRSESGVRSKLARRLWQEDRISSRIL